MQARKKHPFQFFLEIEKYIEEPSGEEVELKRYVEGFCVVSGNIDEQNDMIEESALQGAIQYLRKYSTVLYNHDQDRPIGTVVDSKLVDGRIWVKVLISQSEDEIWQKIVEKVLNSFSVSGMIEDYEFRETEGGERIRVIKKFRIYEISLVSVPANSEAKTLRAYLQKALKDVEGQEKPKFDNEKVDAIFKEVKEKMNLKEKLQMVLKWLSGLEESVEDEKVKTVLGKAAQEIKDILASMENYPHPYPYPQPQPEKSIDNEEIEKIKGELKKAIDELSEKLGQLSEKVESLEKFKDEQEEVSKELVAFFTEFKDAFIQDTGTEE